ncbi:MAG TPA: adenylate/guanylate cyclase domain-containing protein, partial [Leptospiraceae bacterium]|nr:adenylate/guanylate cyclase domain-containing protein [Leptospiraceae bacterium]
VNQGKVYQYIFLKKKRKGFYISFLFSVVLTMFFGFYNYSLKRDQIFSYIDSILFTGASGLKNILPRNYHEGLDLITNNSYEHIKNELNEFASRIGFDSLNSIVERNGKFYYTASNVLKSDTDNSTETSFLQEVKSETSYFKEALNKNKILYLNELNTSWGNFHRIIIPIKSIAKKEYILSADIQLQQIQNRIKQSTLELIIRDIAFFLFIFLSTTKIFISLSNLEIQKNYREWFQFISLRIKLGFFISSLIFFCLIAVSYIYFYNSKIILQKKTLEVCRNFATNISNIAREDLIEDTTYNATNSAVSEILKSDIEGLLDVYIINVYGKYVVDFNKVKINEYASETLISYIQSIHSIDLTEEYSTQTNRNILKISYPIFIEYNEQPIKIGVAIFEYDRDVIYQPVYDMQSAVILTGLFALIITLIASQFLSSYITRPLLVLEKGAQIIAAGNLDHIIPVKTNDEVGLLSKRFNEMSLNLKKSYDELEEKVIERTADLVKSQATLTTVLSNAPLMLFSADTNAIITLSEGQSLNLIGIGSGQAVGISMYEMFEDNKEVLEAIDSALNGEGKIMKLKIEQFTFEVNYSPLYNLENKIVGLISVYFDVTEKLKAQEIINSEKEKSDKLLLNILPEKIANELKETGHVKPVLYDSVTVIFTDFKGFTKIASNMSPEELLEKLDMIFLQFDQICERRKIEKLKTIGDAYMCAGGLPETNLTHPIDACLAAIEMQNFMNETKAIIEQISGEEFWDMRLGIHTGTVVAGVIGKTKFAYDVWGDAVNTASRMESNGSIGKINISHATYNKVKDFFECEYRGKIEAKNKGMIDMYFLLRIKPELSRDKEGIVPNDEFIDLYNKTLYG